MPIKVEDGCLPQHVGLCGREFCRRLATIAADIPPTSYPEQKRLQRDTFLEHIRMALETRSTVNVWMFDDFLHAGSDVGTLTEEIFDCFGSNRIKIFSPNVQPRVVERLSSLPAADRIVTSVGCACRFNAVAAELIRCSGGLDVVMVDGFGGLENSILALLHQMIALRLFRLHPRPAIPLSMVLSDLPQRMQGQSVHHAAVQTCIRVPMLFEDSPWTCLLRGNEHYGNTMHLLHATITSREWSPDGIPGFSSQLVFSERIEEEPDALEKIVQGIVPKSYPPRSKVLTHIRRIAQKLLEASTQQEHLDVVIEL